MTDLPKPDTWNTLRRGSKGPDVAAWQTILIADGYSLDPYGPDGDFGGLTDRKTRLWQTSHGLVPDGVVGAQTRAELSYPEHADTLPPDGYPDDLIGLFNEAGLDVIDESVDPRPNQLFEPVGVIIHHTGTRSPGNSPTLGVIRTGRPYLPGPLAPILIGRLGDIYVTCKSGGVCNHAGMGRSAVLDKVRQGKPLTASDVPWSARDDSGGNRWFYGVELENAGDGIEPFSSEQYESALCVVRALMAKHDWCCNSVIAHHEWTRRKIDPHRDTFNIGTFREAL